MRYLIADVSEGNTVETVYQDPPAAPGSVDDALSNTLISTLDLAPMPKAEADQILSVADRCTFNRSPETDPVLWAAQDGSGAAIKLNGILVSLGATDAPQNGSAEFSAPGTTLSVRPLGDDADWRQNAELIFRLDEGLEVGYRGFYSCGTP